MTIILGPGACQLCGARVVYALPPQKQLMAIQVARWRDASGRVHRCVERVDLARLAGATI